MASVIPEGAQFLRKLKRDMKAEQKQKAREAKKHTKDHGPRDWDALKRLMMVQDHMEIDCLAAINILEKNFGDGFLPEEDALAMIEVEQKKLVRIAKEKAKIRAEQKASAKIMKKERREERWREEDEKAEVERKIQAKEKIRAARG